MSEATSARIRDVAARLRYTPNEAARALKGSRTSTLGVLLPDLHGEFFSEVIRGIDQRARQGGFHLLLSGSHDDPAEIRSLLIKQVCSPVLWEDSMRYMIGTMEIKQFYELGPGRVLTGLLKRIERKMPCENISA